MKIFFVFYKIDKVLGKKFKLFFSHVIQTKSFIFLYNMHSCQTPALSPLNCSDSSLLPLSVTMLLPEPDTLSPSSSPLPLCSLKCRQNSNCYFANIQRQTGTKRGFHNQHKMISLNKLKFI